MLLIVEYRFPEPLGDPSLRSELALSATKGQGLAGLRLTVSTANMLDYVRQDSLRRDAWGWYQERLKARGVDRLPADDPDWITLTLGLRRAYMLACLRGVEVLRPPAARSEDGEVRNESEALSSLLYPLSSDWQPGELPPEWDGLEGLAQNCPADLFVAWADAAEAL